MKKSIFLVLFLIAGLFTISYISGCGGGSGGGGGLIAPLVSDVTVKSVSTGKVTIQFSLSEAGDIDFGFYTESEGWKIGVGLDKKTAFVAGTNEVVWNTLADLPSEYIGNYNFRITPKKNGIPGVAVEPTLATGQTLSIDNRGLTSNPINAIEISDLSLTYTIQNGLKASFAVNNFPADETWYYQFYVFSSNGVSVSSNSSNFTLDTYKITSGGQLTDKSITLSSAEDFVGTHEVRIRLAKDLGGGAGNDYSNTLTDNILITQFNSEDSGITNLQVSARTHNSITISWETPAEYADYVEKYIVEWKETNDFSISTNETQLNSYEITDLNSNSIYNIKVKTIFIVDENEVERTSSVYADPLTQLNDDIYTKPLKPVVSSTGASIFGTKASLYLDSIVDENNPYLNGGLKYDVYLKDTDTKINENLTASIDEILLEGLTENTTYEVQITAINETSGLESEKSDVFTFRTKLKAEKFYTVVTGDLAYLSSDNDNNIYATVKKAGNNKDLYQINISTLTHENKIINDEINFFYPPVLIYDNNILLIYIVYSKTVIKGYNDFTNFVVSNPDFKYETTTDQNFSYYDLKYYDNKFYSLTNTSGSDYKVIYFEKNASVNLINFQNKEINIDNLKSLTGSENLHLFSLFKLNNNFYLHGTDSNHLIFKFNSNFSSVEDYFYLSHDDENENLPDITSNYGSNIHRGITVIGSDIYLNNDKNIYKITNFLTKIGEQ